MYEFVVTTEADKYPQDICLQCVKDKVEMINQLQEVKKSKYLSTYVAASIKAATSSI